MPRKCLHVTDIDTPGTIVAEHGDFVAKVFVDSQGKVLSWHYQLLKNNKSCGIFDVRHMPHYCASHDSSLGCRKYHKMCMLPAMRANSVEQFATWRA